MANPILDRVKPAKTTDMAIAETAVAASSVEAATQELIGAVDTAYKADQVIKSADNIAKLNTQKANSKVMQAAGGNDAQVAMMARLTEEETRIAALLDKQTDIMNDKITGIGIIDGVINAFRSVNTAIEINSAEAERNHTVDQIANVTAAQQSIAQTNRMFTESLTDATIKAEAEKMEAAAKEMRSKAIIDGAKTGAAMMAELQQMEARDVAAKIDLLQLENAKEAREVHKMELQVKTEQLAQEREMMPLKMRSLQATVANQELTNEERVKAKQDMEVLESTYTQQVNMAESALGKTKLSTRQEVMQALSMGGEAAETYWSLITAGSTGVKGATPADAMEYYNKVDPRGQLPQTKGTQLLQTFAELQQQSELQSGQRITDPAAKKAAINAEADKYMEQASKKIVHGTGNPYEAPPLTALAPLLENKRIPLYDKVLKEMGMVETDPQAIVDAAAAAVIAKRLSTPEAVQGIKQIFSVAIEANNRMRGGFRDVGLDDQRSYWTPIKKLAGSISAVSGTYTAAARVPFNLVVAGKDTEEAAKILSTDIYNAAIKTETLNIVSVPDIEKALANAVMRIRKGEQN